MRKNLDIIKVTTAINGLLCMLLILANTILPIFGIHIDVSHVLTIAGAIFGLQTIECCVLECAKHKYNQPNDCTKGCNL